jgi:hypothetical protein
MTWSYTGDPLSSALDLVRFRLGDTEPSMPLCTDEECLMALSDHRGNAYLAAAALLDTKAVALLRQSLTSGGKSAFGEAEVFQTLAAHLRNQATIHSASVYAGGISRSDKQTQVRDRDRVKPFASVHLHEGRPVDPVDLERSEC